MTGARWSVGARRVGVAIRPESAPSWIADAVCDGGATVVAPADADGLVWLPGRDVGPADLARVLDDASGVRWVAISSAGVEKYRELFDDRRQWTAAKGIYGDACAEHALALLLSGLRRVASSNASGVWGPQGGASLFGANVTVVGAGGIAQSLVRLLHPFGCAITVVRRVEQPFGREVTVVGRERLHEALQHADAVVLTPALTDDTRGMIGAAELAVMKPSAWLVNVSRGAVVVTDDLVQALCDHSIAGAALDVTDPEPLPPGHQLWRLENCIVTPHTANPIQLMRPRLAAHLADNVRRFVDGTELSGLVDPALGY